MVYSKLYYMINLLDVWNGFDIPASLSAWPNWGGKIKFFFYPLWKDVSGMSLINEWGRACTVSCDGIGMLMVSSSVSASQSVDSAVFQMAQCLAKIGIVIQNRWSCLRTKQTWCKLIEGWGWKKWRRLGRLMPCCTHPYPGFTLSRGNKEGSCPFAARQKMESNRKDPQCVSSSVLSKSFGDYRGITDVLLSQSGLAPRAL